MAELPERTVKRTYKAVPDIPPKGGDDPFMATLAREQRAREKMVAVEEIKILAERIKECYKVNGVNHFAKCQHLTREYIRRIQEPNFQQTPVEMSDIE